MSLNVSENILLHSLLLLIIMPIRLGIIGLSADQAAWATKTHIGPLKSHPLSEKYSVTAVATSKPETAEAAAKAHGIATEKAYSSPEAIANDPDVDMVVVSVKVRDTLYCSLGDRKLQSREHTFPCGSGSC